MAHPLLPVRWSVALGALALLLTGCAGDYIARTAGYRHAYEAYQYPPAIQGFGSEVKSGPQIDQLLALMDQGMVLHAAGKFEESIQVLAQADKLSERLDFTSVSEEAKVLLSSERERAYRGEDFEKLMISTLQALNYAQLGKDEDALVEVRRVNERMQRMINDEKKPYEQLAVARYLTGVLWEDQGHADDAFIDYDAANKLAGDLGSLAEPLVRLAKETGRDDAFRRLRKQYPWVQPQPLAKDEGQILVVLEAGKVPVKTNGSRSGGPKAEVIAVPVFRDRPWIRDSHVVLDGDANTAVRPTTVTSLEQVAKIHLDHRVDGLVARQFGALAIRTGAAVGVGQATGSEALGLITFLALSYVNQPDLRSWMSLPAEFQLARFRVPAGVHRLSVVAGGGAREIQVDVQPRRVTLIVLRSY
ncbi:MAG: hypothetical protein EHM78_11985 [Myxococcaceae bacterium]|nr:MAG: hypothetical protein EHM78_11985 [Myxococcaceae bacterium]